MLARERRSSAGSAAERKEVSVDHTGQGWSTQTRVGFSGVRHHHKRVARDHFNDHTVVFTKGVSLGRRMPVRPHAELALLSFPTKKKKIMLENSRPTAAARPLGGAKGIAVVFG